MFSSLHGKVTGTELGRSLCGECENKSRVLMVNRNGIYSVCKSCGFTEWEWSWSDGQDYFNHLAERFGVTREQIVQALEAEVSWLP